MAGGESSTQQQVYDFICRYLDQHGWAPSFREIADDVGASVSTVHFHLHSLERHGQIVLGGGPRMIRVVRTWPVRSVLGFAGYMDDLPRSDLPGPQPGPVKGALDLG